MESRAMASLRNASPRLRNYFKEHYIPQVCEVLEPLGGAIAQREESEETSELWRMKSASDWRAGED